jgi:hypothetical protein
MCGEPKHLCLDFAPAPHNGFVSSAHHPQMSVFRQTRQWLGLTIYISGVMVQAVKLGCADPSGCDRAPVRCNLAVSPSYERALPSDAWFEMGRRAECWAYGY